MEMENPPAADSATLALMLMRPRDFLSAGSGLNYGTSLWVGYANSPVYQ
ncbi:hypothetical protein ANO14919_108010 [Xylariales sp. No.14919]|nr:hypothetical protein ANO14919_108010 [Xylariales sp. No.14919]